ncbi:MAG: hypothetical protein LBC31_09455 [Treponema sp.]|nr:hypothetical protein [Treponema sp.]
MKSQLHRSCRLWFFFSFLFGLCAAGAFGQTAERLDRVLAAEQVTYAQAAGIILPAAGLLPPEAPEAEAFDRARKWLPGGAEPDAPIRLGQLSYLAVESFGLSGGFMYALFPGRRYAYRALAWRRFLPLRSDPARTVTGGELLYITGRLLSQGETLQGSPGQGGTEGE